MTSYMLQKTKNTERILTGLILLAYAGMFLPIPVSNALLVLLLLFCAFFVKPAEIIATLRRSTFVQVMTVMYGLLIAGLLYSPNVSMGLFILEKKLSLLLVPLLLMPCLVSTTTPLSLILRWLGYITLGSGLIMIILAVVKQFMLGDDKAFYFENVTPIHYVYYAIYFACGSLILINEVFDELLQKRHGIIRLVALYAYCLTILVLVASKTGMIMFGVASVVVLYYKMKSKKTFLITLLLLILTATIILYFNDTTRSRFSDLTNNLSVLSRDELVHGEEITDLNMRLLFWKISVTHAISDHLWLFGTGTGGGQDYINALYNLPQYELFGYINWDSHNQWVFTFLQSGMVGLTTLGFLYAFFLWKAFRNKDLALLSFLIITGGFTLSESILESNKGIVFVGLFFTLLASPYDRKPSDSV